MSKKNPHLKITVKVTLTPTLRAVVFVVFVVFRIILLILIFLLTSDTAH